MATFTVFLFMWPCTGKVPVARFEFLSLFDVSRFHLFTLWSVVNISATNPGMWQLNSFGVITTHYAIRLKILCYINLAAYLVVTHYATKARLLYEMR